MTSGRFLPFHVAGQRLGWVRRELAPFLLQQHGRLIVPVSESEDLQLSPQLADYKARSAALAELAAALAAYYGKQLRGELYPVIAQWGDTPLAQIDRAAVPWFGLPAFGIHVNGFTRRPDGLHLWIGERAADRLVDAGKLDNLVGGGQPLGLTLDQNLAKEAWEEAGIDAQLAGQAKPAGIITYICERNEGLRNDTLFTYDLELAPTFTPRNTDGEVAAFHPMSLSQVAEIIRTSDRFKFNCNLVAIDFLLRYGHQNSLTRVCTQ